MTAMIKLTLLGWMDGKERPEPLYVNPAHIMWMQPKEFKGSMCTALGLTGYNFHVVETPEQINAAISALEPTP